MSMDDLSFLEALMGGAAQEGETGSTGGVWVVCPDGTIDDAILRLVSKARVVADALGGYVYLLAGNSPTEDAANRAIHTGADNVLIAAGVPTLADLTDFFRERGPKVVLFPEARSAVRWGQGWPKCSAAAWPAAPPTWPWIRSINA